MDYYSKPKDISALDAKLEAQKIAFSPIAFQAVMTLLRTNILKYLSDTGEQGATSKQLAEQSKISEYGVKVLLDMAASMGVVWIKNDDTFRLDKIGHFIVNDKLTLANINFTQDVCYQGMFHLEEAIRSGKPSGLKVFGDWPTIYPALTSLPDNVKKSWFEFDHFYSDHSFPEVMPIIFEDKPQCILDVGGNTGKWTLACLNFDTDVHMAIMDLPQQLTVLQSNVAEQGMLERIEVHPTDLLAADAQFYQGADVIWMSQFLDCFSQEQILDILKGAVKVMTQDTSLFIMETYCDRQRFEAATYCINATSLYFTALANGDSRMYHSGDFIKLIQKAGLYVEKDIDDIGLGHTLFKCRKNMRITE
ncbi:class I SAM-dependent methyltransferase [Candidatus Colwellia aromaticivorans]|uniref:class I SAM-dependent methyltransferase n=1 Tax=Candidatus Colwellia aromaticivorans TaxID=2267621 RepID=UPI000DF3AF3A|nr:class I SAM-dependent methyltransferase [Candidatus Colwellia aromaticivorans]